MQHPVAAYYNDLEHIISLVFNLFYILLFGIVHFHECYPIFCNCIQILCYFVQQPVAACRELCIFRYVILFLVLLTRHLLPCIVHVQRALIGFCPTLTRTVPEPTSWIVFLLSLLLIEKIVGITTIAAMC